MLFIDYERGCDEVLASLRLAAGLDDGGAGIADAYVMLGSGSAEVFQFANAERYLAEGIAFARKHDLDRVAGYMEAWQALLNVYQGRWDAAGERANAVSLREVIGSTTRVIALIALARPRRPGCARGTGRSAGTGDPERHAVQRVAPVRCARAEAAWLAGDPANVGSEAAAAFELASRKQHPWFLGEMAFWLWRIGDLVAAPVGCAEPYALQMSGDWRAAASAWEKIGCPYEQARALADGDGDAQREALVIFERLGARPMAEWLRAHMRMEGPP